MGFCSSIFLQLKKSHFTSSLKLRVQLETISYKRTSAIHALTHTEDLLVDDENDPMFMDISPEDKSGMALCSVGPTV